MPSASRMPSSCARHRFRMTVQECFAEKGSDCLHQSRSRHWILAFPGQAKAPFLHKAAWDRPARVLKGRCTQISFPQISVDQDLSSSQHSATPRSGLQERQRVPHRLHPDSMRIGPLGSARCGGGIVRVITTIIRTIALISILIVVTRYTEEQ